MWYKDFSISISSTSGYMLQKPHRLFTDGRSRKQGWEKRLLFIFILTSPCRHSSPSVASSHYIQILDRAQISALSPCSVVFSRVFPGLDPCHTTSGIAVCQLHKPPSKNLSSCMGLLSQHPCNLSAIHRMIALYLTKAWSCFPRLIFSTYPRGWDYTAAGLEIQSTLNGLLTHSISTNMAVESLATSCTKTVSPHLPHSGFLHPTCGDLH